MNPSLRGLATALPLILASTLQAWVDSGHMAIAAVAYRHLTPAAQKEADRLLQIGGTNSTRDFLTAACWADDIRRDRRETGPWHYIDIHFRSDGRPSSNKPDKENVVWAIHKFEGVLADRSQPDTARADALRFLLHFIGDVHQPLHGSSRDSLEHSDGDKGGNAYRIVAPPEFAHSSRPPKNLHALWDLGAGFFPSTGYSFRPLDPQGKKLIEDLASSIERVKPMNSLPAVKDLDPMHWAQESYHASVAFVYNTPEDAAPTPAYMAAARRIVLQRSALAGYRMAEVLNKLLK